MSDPLVSIVVRTKDRTLLLKEALKSISCQTYRHIQVCLVNDGGADLDIEGIKGVLGLAELSYVRHEKTQGRPAALNSGLDMSQGRYVGILDDDDIYYAGAIQKLLDASTKNEDRPVYGQVVCKKEGTTNRATGANTDRILGEPFSFGKLIFENFIPTNALLIPKYWVEKTGRFDNRFEIFEDWDWIIRLAGVCEPLFAGFLVGEYRIFSDATITGKGGTDLHRLYREKLLHKHLGKVTAGDFLDHLKRVVDGLVLEKDGIIDQIREDLEELEKQIDTKNAWVKEKDEYIGTLGRELHDRDQNITFLEGKIHDLERNIHDLERNIHDLERNIHDLERETDLKDRDIQRMTSSLSWKMTRPLRVFNTKTRKA